ncbi:hypothetical protein [Mesorhizobium sp. M1378]|uniref:hypothetical protein n=1 Tax=Mesorhizobium sp. M1378 TaxID=2957092 RepID=UPI00333BE196
MKIDYDNLSDDPEVAFAQIVEQLDEQLQEIFDTSDEQSDTRQAMTDYMNTITASAKALDVHDFVDWRVPKHNDVWDEYRAFSLRVKSYVVKTRLSKIRINKIYSVALDSATKTKIHHYISRIRDIVESSDLSERKRNSLFTKLNAFAADVDRVRTKFENAMLALVDLADVAKRGTEAVKPITELVNSITALIGEAKSAEPEPTKLPAPEDRKQIEGPKPTAQASAPPRELDDEIPF